MPGAEESLLEEPYVLPEKYDEEVLLPDVAGEVLLEDGAMPLVEDVAGAALLLETDPPLGYELGATLLPPADPAAPPVPVERVEPAEPLL